MFATSLHNLNEIDNKNIVMEKKNPEGIQVIILECGLSDKALVPLKDHIKILRPIKCYLCSRSTYTYIGKFPSFSSTFDQQRHL